MSERVGEAASISVEVEAAGGSSAVEPVTEHWMSGGSEMEPDLVGPARFGPRQEEGSVLGFKQDLKERFGRFAEITGTL